MELKNILPKDGPPLSQVNKYIEKYKNDLIVIKYGGNVLIDRKVFNNFITDLFVLNKLLDMKLFVSFLKLVSKVSVPTNLLLFNKYNFSTSYINA